MAHCVWTSKVRGFQSTRCVSQALFTALRVAAAGVRRCCEGELRALSSFLPRSPVRVYGVLGALPVDSAARRSACVHPVSCLGSERGGYRLYEWPLQAMPSWLSQRSCSFLSSPAVMCSRGSLPLKPLVVPRLTFSSVRLFPPLPQASDSSLFPLWIRRSLFSRCVCSAVVCISNVFLPFALSLSPVSR